MASSFNGGGTVIVTSSKESSLAGGVMVAGAGVAVEGVSEVNGVGVAACVGVDGVAAKEPRFALEAGVLATLAAGVLDIAVREVD